MLGSDSPVTPLDPWGAVRAAAFHRTPEHRVSARAAFNAHTRGGWRASGRDDTGVLVPGAPADFAVWDSADLVVQAPDQRVANWSTDPRSGTPGLPDLTPGRPLPSALRTVVGGRTVFAAARYRVMPQLGGHAADTVSALGLVAPTPRGAARRCTCALAAHHRQAFHHSSAVIIRRALPMIVACLARFRRHLRDLRLCRVPAGHEWSNHCRPGSRESG